MTTAKKPRQQRCIPEVLTPAQADAILAVPNSDLDSGLRHRAILEIMYRAGLRVGEVCSLRPESVRLEDRILEIWFAKAGGRRNTPIDVRLLPWLERWVLVRPECPRFFGYTYGGKVCLPNANGIWKQTKKAARIAARRHPELGIRVDVVTDHCFRRTAASHIYEATRDVVLTARLLGHKDVTNAMAYIGVGENELREVMDRMAATTQ